MTTEATEEEKAGGCRAKGRTPQRCGEQEPPHRDVRTKRICPFAVNKSTANIRPSSSVSSGHGNRCPRSQLAGLLRTLQRDKRERRQSQCDKMVRVTPCQRHSFRGAPKR